MGYPTFVRAEFRYKCNLVMVSQPRNYDAIVVGLARGFGDALSSLSKGVRRSTGAVFSSALARRTANNRIIRDPSSIPYVPLVQRASAVGESGETGTDLMKITGGLMIAAGGMVGPAAQRGSTDFHEI
jgi:hypothetical protein